jgi:phage recombination protein Bet
MDGLFLKNNVSAMNNSLQKIEFTPEQIDLVRKQIAPQANPDELRLFLYQCRRTGLDPLTRQIYCIHRGGKMTIQTSIDGFRVIAERSGTYAGQDEPIWEEEGGKIKKCTVRVYRFATDGQRYCAGVGVAYWDEYAQPNSPMWTKLKHTMISKCAEALALRKAFPQDLSGLYTGDEMQQAGEAVTQETQYEEPNVPDKQERQLLIDLLNNSDLDQEERAKAFEAINTCTDYKRYEAIQHKLEARQKPIDQIINPSQKDISKEVGRKANASV